MNSFGRIKTKILGKLTESYSTNNKLEMKDILKTIKENKDFKEMYLFYEEIENKYFEDKEIAKLYVEEFNSILKSKSEKIKTFCETLNEKLGDFEINENEIYTSLDQLMEEDTLSNIDKKVIAKKKLVEHLTTRKEIKESEKTTHTTNENLLHAVLANNFNILYNNTLSESQKNELKSILSLSNEDLNLKTTELRESILNTVDDLLSESKEDDFSKKLNDVKKEVNNMSTSKYNYYKLLQLKDGLN